jgi:FixJ family two-component response regulator
MEHRVPKKLLIAIVDDDEAVREALQGLVRSAGLAVEIFGSADAFLTSPHLDRTACLILDINMPTMNGFELHRDLRDNGRQMPTIMITGHWADMARAEELQDEIIGCLGKPINDVALFALLGIVRGRRKPQPD